MKREWEYIKEIFSIKNKKENVLRWGPIEILCVGVW